MRFGMTSTLANLQRGMVPGRQTHDEEVGL